MHCSVALASQRLITWQAHRAPDKRNGPFSDVCARSSAGARSNLISSRVRALRLVFAYTYDTGITEEITEFSSSVSPTTTKGTKTMIEEKNATAQAVNAAVQRAVMAQAQATLQAIGRTFQAEVAAHQAVSAGVVK
ncbi:MAG: hypothetical protein JWO88_3595 [Frankiales bacterium]|nr:hypothetical protein [Frankiales bacterium]